MDSKLNNENETIQCDKHYNELINIFTQCLTNSLERVKKNWIFFNKGKNETKITTVFEETIENSYSILWQIIIKFINYEIVDSLSDLLTEQSDLFKAKCSKELETIAKIRHEFEIPEVLEKETFVIKEESEEEEEDFREEEDSNTTKNHVINTIIFIGD